MTRLLRLAFPGVKRTDLGRLLPIALAFALTQAVALLAYLAATTLFLKQCGARFLPWTFLAGYLLALLLSAGFRRLRHWSPFGLLAGYFALHSALLVASAANGPAGSFGSHAVILSVIVPFPVLCWMLFWNSLEGRLVIKETKVWTPLVMASGFLVQVFTGLSTGWLGRLLGIEELYLVAAGVLLASVVVLRLALKRLPLLNRDAGAASGAAEAPRPSPAEAEGEPPLLGTLVRAVFGFAIFKYLVDYQLNQGAALQYDTPAEIAGFLGMFDSLTKALIFGVQTGLLGRLLGRFSPGLIMSAMPVALGLAAAAVLGGAGFPAILAANLIFTVFDKGVNRSCLGLLLAPLSPARARHARLRLDGQVFGAGVISVSLAMIALPVLLTPRVSFAVVLGLSAAYLVWCRRIDGQYVRLLEQNLLAGPSELRESALGRLRAFEGKGRTEIVLALLGSEEVQRRRSAARELAESATPGVSRALSAALAKEPDYTVQAELVTALERSGCEVADLEPCLRSPDARVRANAIETLGRLAPCAQLDLSRHLTDTSPRARSAAAVVLAGRTLERRQLERSLGALARMLSSAEHRQRSAACWALGFLGHRTFVSALIERVGDAHEGVRRQAVLALERIWAPAALPALKKAAADPANAALAPLLERVMHRLEDRTQSEVLFAMGRLSREERQTLSVHLADLGQDAALALSRVLHIEDAGYRGRVGQAVREARSGRARRVLVAAIDDSDGTVRLRVAPFLAALGEPGAPLELWRLLARVRSRRVEPELLAASMEALRALARECLNLDGAGPPRGSVRVRLRRRAVYLARLVGVAVGDPAASAAVLATWSQRDRRLASLSAELLEKLVPDAPLRQGIVALAEAVGNPGALAAVSRELAGAA